MTTYKRGTNTSPNWAGRPDVVYRLNTPNGAPISSANFTYTNSLVGSQPENARNFYLWTGQYTPSVIVLNTDILFARPTKMLDRSGITTVTRWGYAGNYPVARAKNTEILNFSCFESSTDHTGWTFTGPVTTQTTGNFAKTGLNTIISMEALLVQLHSTIPKPTAFLWEKGGTPNVTATIMGGNGSTGITDTDGWKYFSRIIGSTTSVDISNPGGTVSIDELYLVEDGADVETYTVDVLKGLMSRSDANGKMQVYFHDELGRLKTVKDERGFILETNKFGVAKSK